MHLKTDWMTTLDGHDYWTLPSTTRQNYINWRILVEYRTSCVFSNKHCKFTLLTWLHCLVSILYSSYKFIWTIYQRLAYWTWKKEHYTSGKNTCCGSLIHRSDIMETFFWYSLVFKYCFNFILKPISTNSSSSKAISVPLEVFKWSSGDHILNGTKSIDKFVLHLRSTVNLKISEKMLSYKNQGVFGPRLIPVNRTARHQCWES